jgi:hypothetical protein
LISPLGNSNAVFIMKTRIVRCAGLAVLSILAPAAIAATFTVTNANDSGAGSLRDAINQANGDAVTPVDIVFKVPTSQLTPPVMGGVAVIQPQTPLPIIQNIHGHGITINGYTQAGSSRVAGNPTSLVVKVELDGSLIPVPYVPPPPPASKFAHGLHIMSSANRVQGLCVHSFPHDGISIQGIPLSMTGPSGANGNVINWNLVGTDVHGAIARPNGHDTSSLWGGIYIKVLPGSPGIANQNQILENVVSGNVIEGVGIANCPDEGSDVQQNHVVRCLIGIDITGILPLGNGHDGVYIGEGAHHNVIEQNWIGANGYSGVGIVGYGPSQLSTYSNLLTRNKIGVDMNLNPMGNLRHGVAIGSYGGAIWGYAPSNKIDDNIIAWNGLTGVAVQEDPTVTGDNDTSFNTMTKNAIYQNGQVDPGHLGIDLAFEPGVTANDAGDADQGANGLVNFPVITSAIHNAGTTTVNGTIDTPGYPLTIEVFTAIPGKDGSNHGQGAAFMGSTTTSGPSWTVMLTGGSLTGQLLTATATDSAGNTSEFSANVPVLDDNPLGFDWGDAPDPSYPTLAANNGAHHVILPGYHMGVSIDAEPDGQPTSAADGDDLGGTVPDDEDGVYFYPLLTGQQCAIDVTVSGGNGFIDAWIDLNGNGSWLDAGEQIAASVAVTSGLNQIVFNVPTGAATGQTHARVRFSSTGGLAPTGSAQDGEVEDYQLNILPEGEVVYDFGDAPPPYPTLAVNNGARHLLGGPLWLGQLVDSEPDGQPQPSALGDDLNPPPPAGIDDEDGVSFAYALISGQQSLMQVIASVPGFIDVWIDWNGNGSWADMGDNLLTAYSVNPGANYVMIAVPPLTYNGPAKMRVRISSTGYLPPTGFAPDGEVEDHEVLLYQEGGMDFGDAPDWSMSASTNYETTMFNFGAAHFIDSVLFLGMWIDAETDGQPGLLADRDDLTPSAAPDDEDGINFVSPWISGVTAQTIVTVNPAAPGPFYDLDLWVDWDGDGTWAQANEHVLAAVPVMPGPNPMMVPVPSGLTPKWTYARFRLTHPGTGIGYTGYVFGGEVEDYMIPIGMRIQAAITLNTSASPAQVVLTWPAATGAASYSIYSSTNLGSGFPNAPNWTLETTATSLTWSDPITSARKFYIVVAFP